MATAPQARVIRRNRCFTIAYCSLVFLLLLAALAAWRPISVWNAYGAVRLWLAGAQDGIAQAGPYRIHYIVAGAGKPVVLLHGLGMDASSWALYVPALAMHSRVYAIDLLGFGSSDKPDTDYGALLQAQVVHDFLDHLKLQQVDLVGVSMGGKIALHFARVYPDRVRRLVVADASGVAAHVRPPTTFLPDTEKQLAEFRQRMAAKRHSLPLFVARDVVRRLRAQEWVLRRVMERGSKPEELLDGKLQNVTMPVLLLWGEQDTLTPFGWGEALHRQIPHSELVGLRDCGHIALHECRAVALPEIQTFLTTDQPARTRIRSIASD